jgi:hypothetical protein
METDFNDEETAMRFLITAGVDPNKPKPEGDAPPPDDDLIAAYMRYNEEMYKAGVLIASEGLHPMGARARVVQSGKRRTVVDGPFAEAKELVGGLYLIEVKSKEEAIEWALRCPVGLGFDEVLEIYQLTGLEDIPPQVLDVIKRAAPTWSASLLKGR